VPFGGSMATLYMAPLPADPHRRKAAGVAWRGPFKRLRTENDDHQIRSGGPLPYFQPARVKGSRGDFVRLFNRRAVCSGSKTEQAALNPRIKFAFWVYCRG
jgi:hypothetical protein